MIIAPGTLIGQHRIVSLIGEGAMGAVYYATHVVLGRPAAIKVLLPHVARDTVLAQRFVNEARIAAQMNHRNIIDVLDCGQFPSHDAPEGQWYITLEYLSGMSLNKFIAEHHGQPIELAKIVHILGETANGLHAVHEHHELVHRDVKPDNLFLVQTADDPMRVKILDFGIAKLRQAGSAVQTQSQLGMGTPAYAAPEQLRDSKDVDARADVWALGVIAHEMIAGVRPWGATTSMWEIIAQHSVLKRAPDPRVFRPDIPERVAEVIAKAMEPDPSRRWRSTKDFARALAEAAPMPFSANSMAILERYAPELSRASSCSLTAGRRFPPEIQVASMELMTAHEHPGVAPPPSPLSERVPEMSSLLTRPLGVGATRATSTMGATSGQSFSQGVRPARSLIGSIAAAVVIGAAIGATVWWLHGSQADHGALRSAPPVAMGSAQVARPAPATSTLVITSEPTGADILVDGVSQGRAPLDLTFPIGAEVELGAALPGYAPTRQSVKVEVMPTILRLELSARADAGMAPSSTPPAPATTPEAVPHSSTAPNAGRDATRRGKKPASGTGRRAMGSEAGTDFDSDDVL